MISSFVFTSKMDSPKMDLAFVMKKEDTAKTAILISYGGWLILVDPPALTRGTLRIRWMEHVTSDPLAPINELMYSSKLYELIQSPATDPLFINPHVKVIYSKPFGVYLKEFPKDQAMIFARRAQEASQEEIYGTNLQITTREKALKAENAQLIAKLRAKALKKKKKPAY